MQFNSIKLHGFGPFTNEISLDLDNIPGELIAVCGPNGAGKTTLLEAFVGAFSRHCPTRGQLKDLATARDSFLEVTATHGRRYTVRHFIDCVSGKAEVALLDENLQTLRDDGGNGVVDSAKVTKFDAWARRVLPLPEILYASTFAPQGSGGFLDLKAGERKALILRIKGIEHYELLAKTAGDHARAAKAQLETLVARINDEEERGGDIASLSAGLAKARETLILAEQAAHRAAEDLETARQHATAARLEIESNATWRREHGRLTDRLAELGTFQVETEKKLADNLAVVGGREVIEQAVSRSHELDTLITNEREELARLSERKKDTDRQHARVLDRFVTIQRERGQAEKRLQACAELLEQKSIIEFVCLALPGCEVDHQRLVDHATVVDRELCELTSQQLIGAEEREQKLLDGHIRITQLTDVSATSAIIIAKASIVENDELVAVAAGHPELVDCAKSKLEVLHTEIFIAESALTRMRATAGKAGELLRVEADHAAQLAEIEQALLMEEECKTESSDLVKQAQKIQMTHDTKAIEVESLTASRAELEPAIKLADQLAIAGARIEELEPQLAQCLSEQARLTLELGELVVPEKDPVVPLASDEHLKLTRAELVVAQRAVAITEDGLARAQISAGKLEQLTKDRQIVETDLADWARLQKDLGKNGVQAIIVDAAGPELSELTNDLLSSCFGSRWTVTFETTREGTDGRQLEDYRVQVVDNDLGRTADAESLSGGEKVIVGEAIRKALSIMACRHSNIENPTFICDETGASLDADNAGRYIQMLRRAAKIVGASKTLFVSHDPATWELADARVRIADGRLEIT